MEKEILIKTAHHVLRDEISSLKQLDRSLGQEFTTACQWIAACSGRVVFMGVGHSGHVGCKSAASMSSMSTPAYFLHAGEANHGDLGLVQGDDVVILISNSGETAEVLSVLPRLKELGVRTIAITGNTDSTLAGACGTALAINAGKEAGPFKFAGSSSALNTMALCDALIMAVAAYKGLSEEAYLLSHPGGAVGDQLKKKLG